MARRRSTASGRADGKPNPVDIHVGSRLRQRRTLLGLSQQRLGDALGLTFQQIQKYERGANRVGASRLFDIARVLDTDINYFFAEMAEAVAARSPRQLLSLAEEDEPFLHNPDPLAKRETLELAKAYLRITDPSTRKRLFELTKALADHDDND
jgi:transcriptional regulator with XRE-family HTH domain|tara:strand:- start:1752 stop:2210 length:459 start_codon:yes stop_codon:yes gene_type:complete